MLRDKSTFQSTRIQLRSSLQPLYFSTQGLRQIVLRYGDSVLIGMGGDNSCFFQFEIVWPPSDSVQSQRVEEIKDKFVNLRKKARLAVTTDDTPTTPGSRYESRIQTPANKSRWLHRHVRRLGAGAFGEVYETVNMHTGDHYAVKVLRRPRNATNDVSWRKDVLKQVTTLQKLHHVSKLLLDVSAPPGLCLLQQP